MFWLFRAMIFQKRSGEVLYDGNATAPLLLGDIVVAYETAALEAQKEDKELADHLSHLVVHGTLHLLGYDHKMMPIHLQWKRLS